MLLCVLHNLGQKFALTLYRCLHGILKEKLVVLVTHQVHFALQTDQLLVLNDVNIDVDCSQCCYFVVYIIGGGPDIWDYC